MATWVGLLGKKIGMTQIFGADGMAVPVTVLQAGPCVVLALRNARPDGTVAAQLGFQERKRSRVTKPEKGHAAKAKVQPQQFVREVAFSGDPSGVAPGQTVTVEALEGVQRVDVAGLSKGRGWAGVMKRWHFSGGDKTHGSKSHRRPGSIGQHTWPSRVLKGVRMSGHLGHARRTVRNLRVVSMDKQAGTLLVEGGVPGPNGGFLVIRRALASRQGLAAAGAPGGKA